MPQPIFPKGYLLTEFSSLALTVEGQDSGGQGVVVWGPNALRGGDWEAVKMVRPDRATEAARAAFAQEALVWCHLWPHTCVIGADGLLLIPGLNHLPVLVLEYASNGSLREVLHNAHQPNSRIPLQTAFNWVQMIAAGLEHLHTPDPSHERPEPLVHCDLKPANVLLDGQGWAKLTDLGLAKAYARGGVLPVTDTADVTDQRTIVLDPEMLTRSRTWTAERVLPEMGTQGAVQGTLPYMPPEQ